MFAEIAEMNQTAQQNFIKRQLEPYGPGEIDNLLRVSEELKRIAKLNRSVAMETRLQSQALIKQQKEVMQQARQSSASNSDGSNTV
jgi:hypothetical protein